MASDFKVVAIQSGHYLSFKAVEKSRFQTEVLSKQVLLILKELTFLKSSRFLLAVSFPFLLIFLYALIPAISYMFH